MTRVASLSRERGCSCSFTIQLAIFLLLILDFVFSADCFYHKIRKPCGHPGVFERVAALAFPLNLLLLNVASLNQSRLSFVCKADVEIRNVL